MTDNLNPTPSRPSAASRIDHYRRLESQLATAKQAVKDKEREFDAFRIEIASVKVGDIVTLKDGKMARVAVVRCDWVRPCSDGTFTKPWIKVNFQTKSGSWSASEKHAYNDWTHIPNTNNDGEQP